VRKLARSSAWVKRMFTAKAFGVYSRILSEV
jgi:hypothetical protein